ncbi:HDOD domain-containing protein [Congregibacter variabilis]|uniref:HDOD domain-containing protein n=1 Tax=Congregibacter variabilis TaxID=3081200 RepID=A0ABZ0I6Y2_9GAMM|nr:HDOD domain-containing protein [Congregibacter sp. IMCC43200]
MTLQESVLSTASNGQLPVLPVVITALMSLDLDAEGSFAEVLALANVDPCLAIKILQSAGAAGAVRGGDTLPKAMVRLGVSAMHRLVSERSSATVFVPVTDAEKCLWLHFIQVALCAQFLVKNCKALKVDADKAYLAGLIHDIGRLVDYEQIAQAPNEIESSDYHDPEALLHAETHAFGHSHVGIGVIASKRWKLPDYLIAAVEHHHDNLRELRGPDLETRTLVELVQCADELSVFVLRRDSSDLAAVKALCQRFLDSKSAVLAQCGVDVALLQKALAYMQDEAETAFLRLKLGKAPVCHS